MAVNILDRIFFKVSIRRALFNCFLIIFLLTAFVTLAGLIKLLPMEPKYLDNLFYALILELIGCVIGMYKATFGKGILEDKTTDLKIQLVFPGTIDIANPSKIIANYYLMDSDISIDPVTGECRVYRDGQSLYINIKDAPLDKDLYIEIELGGKMYQGSQHLETRPLYLKATQDV